MSLTRRCEEGVLCKQVLFGKYGLIVTYFCRAFE